ncbi:zinc-dependent alcohol dehydrogenase family protein [Cupriavidus taiwanensis]|uniref:zinc-dependent alcohol dehydrogenase family protein n=1 Tax=Cupriavidus taiwanensis TaxID=164546 RepID=UPI0039C1733D
MKAMLLRAHGGPENLHLEDVAAPVPQAGEVLIRIHAASVNPIDLKIRAGLPVGPQLPCVLGCDFSGVVEQVGEGTGSFRVGDEVYGCAGGVRGLGGTLAEFMVCDPALLALKPRSLSHREAAALPLVAITAWQLIDRPDVKAGENVLVYGAAGGVGHIAVQMAKARRARVSAVVSNQEKARLVKNLGADDVILYVEETPQAYVQRLTHGRGFDVVIDTVGGTNLDKAFQVAAIKGRVAASAARSTHDLSPLHAKALSLHAIFMLLPMLTGEGRSEHGQVLKEVAALCEAGQLRPILHDIRFNLAQSAQAQALMEAGGVTGKIVVDVATQPS